MLCLPGEGWFLQPLQSKGICRRAAVCLAIFPCAEPLGKSKGDCRAVLGPGIMGTVLLLLCAGHTNMEMNISLCPRCMLPTGGVCTPAQESLTCQDREMVLVCPRDRITVEFISDWLSAFLTVGVPDGLCRAWCCSPRGPGCLDAPQVSKWWCPWLLWVLSLTPPTLPAHEVLLARTHGDGCCGLPGRRPPEGPLGCCLPCCDIFQVELQRSLEKDVSRGVGEETRRLGPLAHGSAVSPRPLQWLEGSQLPPPLRHPPDIQLDLRNGQRRPACCSPGRGQVPEAGLSSGSRQKRRKPCWIAFPFAFICPGHTLELRTDCAGASLPPNKLSACRRRA